MRWKVVWFDLSAAGLERVHFAWGVVFAAEALSAAIPDATLVLADHDSAPTALFEVAQLRNLAAKALQLHENSAENLQDRDSWLQLL